MHSMTIESVLSKAMKAVWKRTWQSTGSLSFESGMSVIENKTQCASVTTTSFVCVVCVCVPVMEADTELCHNCGGTLSLLDTGEMVCDSCGTMVLHMSQLEQADFDVNQATVARVRGMLVKQRTVGPAAPKADATLPSAKDVMTTVLSLYQVVLSRQAAAVTKLIGARGGGPSGRGRGLDLEEAVRRLWFGLLRKW